MSDYVFETDRPHLNVIVGWDDDLQTFHATVLDAIAHRPGLLLRIGTRHGQLPSIAHLIQALAPHVHIPAETVECLMRDSREFAPSLGLV